MKNSTKRTGVTTAGALVGSKFGPGGAVIGGGIGGVVGQVLFPDEIEKLPGASAIEKQMMGLQTEAAEKALSIQGLSAQETASIGQMGRETQQLAAEKISSLPMRMSAFDRSRMAKMLLAQSKQTQLTVTDKIARLDPRAQMRNIAMGSDIASKGAQQAAQMRVAEQTKARYEALQRKEQAQAFNQSVTSMVGAIGTGYDLGSKSGWSWGDDSVPVGQSIEDIELDNDLAEVDNELLAARNAREREVLNMDVGTNQVVEGNITVDEYLNDSFSAADYL